MRKKITHIALMLFTAIALAQVPQKMSYQAVVRNSSNALITGTPVGIKISILQQLSTGNVVYAETQNVHTNENGLLSLEIGSGTPVSGIFSDINWAQGPYFIKTEIDILGGTNYTITGTSQLMSVPYALFAASGNAGPQGPPGPQGIQGATGDTGAQGLAGPIGPKGATGDTGAQGLTGSIGPTGAQGLTGPIGPTGATGAQGATGTQGLKGATGDTGAQGIQGLTGSIGPTGAQGLQGATGVQGIQGLTGPIGPTGAQGIAGNGANFTFLTKTTDYTITTTDVVNNLVLLNTSGSSHDYILPSALSAGAGKSVMVAGTTFQTINVKSNGTDKITGAFIASETINILNTLGSYMSYTNLISDGVSKWYVISAYY